MADPQYKGPKSAVESRSMWESYQRDYMKAYPRATREQAFEAFSHGIRQMGGVEEASGFSAAPYDPDTAYGKLTSLHQAGVEQVGKSVTELTGSQTAGDVASAFVPASPVETGAAIGSGAAGVLTKTLKPIFRPAARIVGGFGGALAGSDPNRPILENIPGAGAAAAGQALGETARGVGMGLRNVKRTWTPFTQGEKTAANFLAGLEEDLGVPVLRNRLMISNRENAGSTLAQSPAGRIREVFGQIMQDAEDKIRGALPNGGTTSLAMPTLTTMTFAPRPGMPGGGITKTPTFDEALEIVKKAKSDARLATKKAMNQNEILQAQQMQERADKLESEFQAAVTNHIGAKWKPEYAAAQARFGKALRLEGLLDDPSVFAEGPRGITVDQPALRAAILKNIKDFNPEMFPEATRAISGGQPFGASRSVRVPGLSVQPNIAGTRQYLGGFPILTQFPQGSAQGPGMIQSSLLGLTGGEISRDWRSRGDRGSLPSPVQ